MTKNLRLVLTYEYQENLDDHEGLSSFEQLIQEQSSSENIRDFLSYIIQNPSNYKFSITQVD
jgi:hypothetical protein